MKSKRTLPPAWVDRIFARLDGVYGGEFGRKFSRVVGGRDEGIEAAKATWADELGGYADSPEAIAFALDVRNLPEKAPNLVQFLGICKTAPRKQAPQLEHKATPEELEEQRQRIEEMVRASRAERKESVFTLWYEKILNNPKKYPSISLQFAREAFKNHKGKEWAA